MGCRVPLFVRNVCLCTHATSRMVLFALDLLCFGSDVGLAEVILRGSSCKQ